MGSQPGGGTHTPMIDWVAVTLIIVAAILVGLGMVLTSWPIAIVGFVLGVAGTVIALAAGIMEHTEDYEVRPQNTIDTKVDSTQR